MQLLGFSAHVPTFPWKIHEALELNEDQSIITWIPRAKGRPNSFKILDQEAFVSKLLKKYFQQTKFKSFQRQLNLWGFQRTSDGGYTHEFFVKGEPSLCQYITRKQSKKASPKKVLDEKKAVATKDVKTAQTSTIESNDGDHLVRQISDIPTTICIDLSSTVQESSTVEPMPLQTMQSSSTEAGALDATNDLIPPSRCASPLAEVSLDGESSSLSVLSDSLSQSELDMLVEDTDCCDIVWGKQFHVVEEVY